MNTYIWLYIHNPVSVVVFKNRHVSTSKFINAENPAWFGKISREIDCVRNQQQGTN